MKILSKFVPFLVIIFSVCVFFYPFLLKEKLPIPADTIIGLYYPFRDLYSGTNPNGIAYKNFLITDPVRQQYPWKNLGIGLEKQLQLPLWNPYEMTGTPLLANFQSSSFYPLNLILFIPPFALSWSVFIFLQPILGGFFLYLYLKNLKLDPWAAVLSAITWSLCGFSIAWLEWGVILHTALWLPLILLAIDKIVSSNTYKELSINSKILWAGIYVSALVSSFLAGHLQTFFYLFSFSFIYLMSRWIQNGKKITTLGLFTIYYLLFTILIIPQLFPTLQFILLSNRAIDQFWTQPGWFIPYQNLIQFIAPDFFGNPATLNYWGIWNYGEFIGYIGIGSFILALYAVLFRHDKKTWLFLCLAAASLLFATQNPISQLPYALNIPLVSTAQPTRLMFVIDISLAILAGLGLDHLIKTRKRVWMPILIVGILIVGLWASVIFGKQFFQNQNDIFIAKNNLKLPTILFTVFAVLFLGYEFLKNKRVRLGIFILIFILMLFDLLRFGWKFTPFTRSEYVFPNTKVTRFLQNQPGVFRIATTDSRILPPNFSVMYKIQSVEGYDPLYLKNYAMFIAANERSDHSIIPPYGFNRIITPRSLDSQAIDFLNVKYVLSLSDLANLKFKKVFQEGQTRIYQNKNVLPRAFFVEKVIQVQSDEQEAKLLFENDLSKTAFVDENFEQNTYGVGQVHILSYSSNQIIMQTTNKKTGFLVFSDTYYPAFHATIDGVEAKIIRVNLAFRGIVVPAGNHTIVFEAKLF